MRSLDWGLKESWEGLLSLPPFPLSLNPSIERRRRREGWREGKEGREGRREGWVEGKGRGRRKNESLNPPPLVLQGSFINPLESFGPLPTK